MSPECEILRQALSARATYPATLDVAAGLVHYPGIFGQVIEARLRWAWDRTAPGYVRARVRGLPVALVPAEPR
jgi:hypothetical protein